MYVGHWNLPISELYYIIKEATDSFRKLPGIRKHTIAIFNDVSMG